MKNIKQTIIGVFAIIGVLAIASSFTNKSEVNNQSEGDWAVLETASGVPAGYLYNKRTGEAFYLQKEKKTKL
ncbi:MAG: hypothetical protein CMC57_01110 [Flavobacteriaceae bacterium]|nr:hypothetical protein [Flavobacteriaceae bacterium]